MDLTSELRSLDDKLYEYKGSETNANMYLSAGTTKHRASFDPHNHDYHVIVKQFMALVHGSSMENLKR